MAALNLLNSYGGSDSESNASDADDQPMINPAIGAQSEISVKTQKASFFEASDDQSSSEAEESSKSAEKPLHMTDSLKNPFRSLEENGDKPLSVFANPFKDAEEAEKSTLEKHVKLAPKLEDVKEINGRKICWNYRKGRCRFGTNCVFAHDSELLQKQQKFSLTDTSNSVVTSSDFEDKIEANSSTSTRKKKRPGLTQGITPGNKVMKIYRKQQAGEQPWLVKK